MTLKYLNPANLPIEMLRYAIGDTNTFPNVVGIPRKQIVRMVRQRQAFIRNLLGSAPHSAYALPDFNELMAAEIWSYAKRALRPELFRNWDTLIRQTPQLWNIFNHESASLNRDYQDALDSDRRFIKHQYISITSKRRAFALAVRDPRALAEIELACRGYITYGLP